MATGTVSVSGGATPQYRLVNQVTGARSTASVALVDTGDQSAIASPALIAQTGAPQVAVKPVVGVDGTPQTAPQYLVDWDLGKFGYVPASAPGARPIYTLGMDISALGVSALIGRNILQTGYFGYNGAGDQYTLQVGTAPPPAKSAPASSWLAFGVIFGLGAIAIGAAGR